MLKWANVYTILEILYSLKFFIPQKGNISHMIQKLSSSLLFGIIFEGQKLLKHDSCEPLGLPLLQTLNCKLAFSIWMALITFRRVFLGLFFPNVFIQLCKFLRLGCLHAMHPGSCSYSARPGLTVNFVCVSIYPDLISVFI